ncbi:hypothetical protein [Carboxylicivirga caseinilyticus]|uniref:hypothetical protein n=1 Tax=Carboxylicivirga caseinilyticus TaxID=3417572 RepID=UPI003D343A78|nr:hypothetical protein [Marinilabiliaceae bacterium A049]
MKRTSLILFFKVLLSVYSFGQQPDTTIYINPEIQPIFKYDTCSSLKSSMKEYFIDNYKMPRIIIDNGYIGNIIVEFVIEKDSTLSNINIGGRLKPTDY